MSLGRCRAWQLAAALAACLTPVPAQTPFYSRSYAIFIKGTLSGTESVTEEWDAAGNVIASSTSEIALNDGLETKRMAFVTRMLLAAGTHAPVSYAYRYTSGTSGDGYEVTVKGGRASRILTRNGRTSEASTALDPAAVILDFSVYHQYDYLIRKYDFKKGGRQTFPNFIPLIAADIPLAVTRLEDSRLTGGRIEIAVRNFRVEFTGLWSATLSADKDSRLVRLSIREQDLEVLRTDVAPEPAPQEPAKPPQS
jgi:hypothetical protein